MEETYTIDFSNYLNNPYFSWGTATLSSITFYTTNTNTNNKG